jgi:hypothetical protein
VYENRVDLRKWDDHGQESWGGGWSSMLISLASPFAVRYSLGGKEVPHADR